MLKPKCVGKLIKAGRRQNGQSPSLGLGTMFVRLEPTRYKTLKSEA